MAVNARANTHRTIQQMHYWQVSKQIDRVHSKSTHAHTYGARGTDDRWRQPEAIKLKTISNTCFTVLAVVEAENKILTRPTDETAFKDVKTKPLIAGECQG